MSLSGLYYNKKDCRTVVSNATYYEEYCPSFTNDKLFIRNINTTEELSDKHIQYFRYEHVCYNLTDFTFSDGIHALGTSIKHLFTKRESCASGHTYFLGDLEIHSGPTCVSIFPSQETSFAIFDLQYAFNGVCNLLGISEDIEICKKLDWS